MDVVTIGDQPRGASAALRAADARVVAALDWSALETLARVPSGLVVAAVPGDTGQGALEHLAALLAEDGRAALVAFEAQALEPVAAALIGPQVTLLCDPDAGEWAAALAVAGLSGARVPVGVREGGDEGERLRRLHGEVARIAAQLLALSDEQPVDGSGDGGVGDRRTRYAPGPASGEAIDAGEIRRVIRARRLRAQFVDPRLMEDPGWDMLLDLFAAELEDGQVSVSSLCIASGVAPTTGLRWITRMMEAGLLARVPDRVDRRRAFLVLTPAASDAMRAYVAAARRAGLPVV